MPTLETYWKALDHIQGQFYNPDTAEAPDETTLTYAAIRGVLGSLYDPYTRFLPPDQYSEMQRENRGTFPGIGVELRSEDGKVLVDKVVPNSPAAAAPVEVKDQLLRVDGVSVVGKSTDEVGNLLRGEEDTDVNIVVQRAGQLRSLTLTRKEVSYPHFESRMLAGGIGYMHLLMFDEQAADNIDRALQQFSKAGARGVILDLRDNPGGLLNAAVDVASKFIPTGTVVWVQERGGQRSALPTNNDPRARHRLPLVVLVNHYSASASEIVSGAIHDSHSGTLVGLTTWGKGLVQEVIPLNDNSALALTTARYYTPNGTDINRKGINPDISVGHVVADPDDGGSQADYDAEKNKVDAEQLHRAITVLKGAIASRPLRHTTHVR